MAKTLPGDGVQLDYVSTGISLIMHTRAVRGSRPCTCSPDISRPRKGRFGGGDDHTPMLPEQRSEDSWDAVTFHDAMKRACGAHDRVNYGWFKPWTCLTFCRIAGRRGVSAASFTIISIAEGGKGEAMHGYLGFIEFFVVALFAMAWGVLELVGRRLDRKKEAERAKEQNPVA